MILSEEEFEHFLYEEESDSLDFKSKQYSFMKASDDEKGELLKDILAFTNSWCRTDAFILIGVDEVKGRKNKVLGINQHLEDANIQQFVSTKTQRPIEFLYFPFTYEDKKIGIIKIPRQERPVYLKKNFGRLKINEVYVRRGTSTEVALPDEIAKMGKAVIEKSKTSLFTGTLKIGFNESYDKQIELPTIGKFVFPSEKAKKNIKDAIRKKKNSSELKIFNKLPIPPGAYPLKPKPLILYEIEELEEKLKKVHDYYMEIDIYEYFEVISQKINIYLLNTGEQYIEDPTIICDFENIDGLNIAERIYEKPSSMLSMKELLTSTSLPSYIHDFYPFVKISDSVIQVEQNIEDIKHHLPIKAFGEPVRIVLRDELIGKKINITCSIFGRNLQKPIRENLILNVIPNKSNEKEGS